jgi:hypothetical protein
MSSKDTGTTVHTNDQTKPVHDSIPKDFGFLPVPERLRYDPDKPFYFGTMLNLSFGFASTFSKFFDCMFTGHIELMERSDYGSCSKLVLLSADIEWVSLLSMRQPSY